MLDRVDLDGERPDGLLDAYIAMIPKADGDAALLGQHPSCVLPVVYRLWASVRLGHLAEWFRSSVPGCVFSAGGGCSSVEAWYSTALDIEEVLSGAADSDVHLFAADVVKSFDTVDRDILDRVLSILGLPGWYRHATFGIMLVLEFGLSFRPAFRKPGTERRASHRDVLLACPWCRVLESVPWVIP